VVRPAGAAGCVVDLARIGLGIGDELGNGFDRKRRIDHCDQRNAHETCDRHDVADEIEIELVVIGRIDGVGGGGQQQRVAVRRGTRDRLGRDVGRRARPVLDDELLTEPFRQPLSDNPGANVGAAAGGIADDDAHGPRRIGLRPSDARDRRQRGGASGQMQKSSAGKFH